MVRTFSKAFGVAEIERIYYFTKNNRYMLSIKPIYEINAFNMKLVKHLLKNIKVMKDYVKKIEKGRFMLKNF